MKLSLETSHSTYQIQHYDAHSVTINEKVYSQNLILMPEYLAPWSAVSFATLQVTDFELLVALHPQVVLLGTGLQHRFPSPHLLAPLINQQISIEVMTTAAVCRTYTILTGDGRVVAAALLFE